MTEINEKNSIKERIKEVLLEDLDANLEVADLKDDLSLYEDGVGLDSISIVNLIVMIEKKFNISLEEEDLNEELFKSINHLTDVVYTKTKSNDGI
jgi:acyl carrier protein